MATSPFVQVSTALVLVQAIAGSAMAQSYRAIMNPRCQPWPLSAEKFNAWRTITFNFDPRDY